MTIVTGSRRGPVAGIRERFKRGLRLFAARGLPDGKEDLTFRRRDESERRRSTMREDCHVQANRSRGRSCRADVESKGHHAGGRARKDGRRRIEAGQRSTRHTGHIHGICAGRFRRRAVEAGHGGARRRFWPRSICRPSERQPRRGRAASITSSYRKRPSGMPTLSSSVRIVPLCLTTCSARTPRRSCAMRNVRCWW